MLHWFFTFPEFRDSDQIKWRTEWKLKNHVERFCEQLIESNEGLDKEAKLARYLFEQFKEKPSQQLLCHHWMCFLSRHGMFSVQKTHVFLPKNSSSELSLQTLFEMVLTVALEPADFFGNFDSQRHETAFWYPALRNYTKTKMLRLLYDKVRKINGMEFFGRTNLGLAIRSSRKRVLKSLKKLGKNQQQLSQYLLAWVCFKEVINSLGNLTVDKLQQEHFQQVAKRYNQLQCQLNLPANQHKIIDDQDIKKWIEEIGEAIRSCLNSSLIISLDAPEFPLADNDIIEQIDSTSLQGKIFGTNLISGWDILIEQENNQFTNKLKICMYEFLQIVESEAEQILFLLYALELTQAQVAIELERNQSRISRQHKKLLRERLLPDFLDCLQQDQNYEFNSENLKEVFYCIKEMLSEYYCEIIDKLLTNALQIVEYQGIKIIHSDKN